MDRSLQKFLITLFGVGGIVILLVSWLRPMPGLERIISTLIGGMGLIGVLIWTLVLWSNRAKVNIENRLISDSTATGHTKKD